MAENRLTQRLLARPFYLLGLALLAVGYFAMTYFVTHDHLGIMPSSPPSPAERPQSSGFHHEEEHSGSGGGGSHQEEEHSSSSGSSGPAVGPDDLGRIGNATLDDLGRISNATLGFEKVFVINLAERADKRDAMTLAAKLTDIQLEWATGVKGEDVPDKTLPIGVSRKKFQEGGVGSWRSHINMLRTIVEQNIASALILEDDTDWDVRVKQQLVSVANGTRELLELAGRDALFAAAANPADYGPIPMPADDGAMITTTAVPYSPYGDAWDILHFGHCGEMFPDRMREPESTPGGPTRALYAHHAMPPDGTLPKDPGHVKSLWTTDFQPPHGVRWVHFSGSPICSAAYAVSQAGARKLLLALGGGTGAEFNEKFDVMMLILCRDHTPWDDPEEGGGEKKEDEEKPGQDKLRKQNVRCLSVTPAVMSQHMARGRKSGDSDITGGGEDEVREKGESPNLVFSARLNLDNLVHGREMESQWPADAPEKKGGGH